MPTASTSQSGPNSRGSGSLGTGTSWMEMLVGMGIHHKNHQQAILRLQMDIIGEVVSRAHDPAGKLHVGAVERAKFLEIAANHKVLQVPRALRRKRLSNG